MSEHKRKNYYIKDFQLKFVIQFCLLMFLGSLIMGIILYYFSQETVTTAFENSRLIIKSTGDYILPAILMSSAIMLGIISIVSCFIIMLFTHRIAGPIYRFEKHTEEVKDGYLANKIYLRGTDEIQELASKFNEMTQSLNGKIVEVKKERDKFTLLKQDISNIVQEEEIKKENIELFINKFEEITQNLSEKLEYFKTN